MIKKFFYNKRVNLGLSIILIFVGISFLLANYITIKYSGIYYEATIIIVPLCLLSGLLFTLVPGANIVLKEGESGDEKMVEWWKNSSRSTKIVWKVLLSIIFIFSIFVNFYISRLI